MEGLALDNSIKFFCGTGRQAEFVSTDAGGRWILRWEPIEVLIVKSEFLIIEK